MHRVYFDFRPPSSFIAVGVLLAMLIGVQRNCPSIIGLFTTTHLALAERRVSIADVRGLSAPLTACNEAWKSSDPLEVLSILDPQPLLSAR